MDLPRILAPSAAWRRRLQRRDTHHLAILSQDGVDLPVFLEWDNTRLMAWSAPLRPTIQDGLLKPEGRGSSEAVLMLLMTKARKAEIQADGPHAMADRALRTGLALEARLRLSLARRTAAACPDSPAFRSALRALAKGALETGRDQVLRDADVPPALDRRTSAHERLAAAAKAQEELSTHPHAAARKLARLLAAG